jgi:hypothetical protein
MFKGTLLTAAVATAIVLSLLMTAAPVQAAEGWEALGDTPFHSAGFSTATLPDGRVFFNGGQGQDGPELYPETWLYDPSTDTWEMREPSPIATHYSSAVAMPNGNVYVFSGYDQSRKGVRGVMIYNVSTDSWSIEHDQLEIGILRAAAAIDGNRIMLAGGFYESAYNLTDECLIYYVKENVFVPSDPLLLPLYFGALVKAGDSLYYVGGWNLKSELYSDILRYEISMGRWILQGKMPNPCLMNNGVLGADGLVYLQGLGLFAADGSNVMALDLRDSTFKDIPTYPIVGSGGGIAATADGRVIVFGGNNNGVMSQKVYSLSLYDKNAWLGTEDAGPGEAVRVYADVNAVAAGPEGMSATAYLVKDGVTYGRYEMTGFGNGTASALMALPEDLVPGEYEVHIMDVDLGTGIAGTMQFEPLSLSVTEGEPLTDRIGELEDQLDGKMDAWVGYVLLGMLAVVLVVVVLQTVRKR